MTVSNSGGVSYQIGTSSSGATFQVALATTDGDGLVTWTFPLAYASGVVPQCNGIAIGPSPASGVVISVQLEGNPTNTSAKFRVTKSNITAAALLGLNILSLPASPGTTVIQVFATSP